MDRPVWMHCNDVAQVLGFECCNSAFWAFVRPHLDRKQSVLQDVYLQDTYLNLRSFPAGLRQKLGVM